MKALTILLPIAPILFSGCAKKNTEELSVSIGVYEDGMPFWDWKGILYRETSINGTVRFPTGSIAEANFEKNELIITVVSKLDDDDIYTVSGHYTSNEPFTLHLLGANTEEGIELKLGGGKGVIDFSGTLESTYTKPIR